MGQPLKSALHPRPVIAVDLTRGTKQMNGVISTNAVAATDAVCGAPILLPGAAVDWYGTAWSWVIFHSKTSPRAGNAHLRS
jgi:hypothetical protein